ncbi:vWA domain-containing protein [Bremerella cremea]|nr:vWA domain-containing protein [Bremerella cremea]
MGIVLLSVTLVAGCGENVEFSNPFDKEKKPAAKQDAKPASQPKKQDQKPKVDKEALARQQMIKQTSLRGGGTSRFGESGRSVGANATVGDNVFRMQKEIASSVDFAPTMLVWVVDSTVSATELRDDWAKAAKKLYSEFDKNGLPSGKPPKDLATAIVSFGEKANFVLEEPTSDFQEVIASIDKIPRDDSGKEATFDTISQVLDKYGPLKSQQLRELLVVVVTDEAGDDWQNVDAVVEKANSTGVRLYAIGVPAPMGRMVAEVPPGESRSDGQMAMIQGPETRHSQRINMKFSSGGFGGEDVDSGYGPFGLGYLAYQTRGEFLVSRLRSAPWPGSAMRFSDEVMRKYPPQYLTEQAYQAMLAENKALDALDRAAGQGQVEAMAYPSSQFVVLDEARLKNALDGAQRIAARLEPLVNAVYEPLAAGEKDRDKIQDKRWQASYDLALGRAAANKARVDGYNQMLAILKGGRKFEDPTHNTWKLEPADSLEEAGSRLEKMRLQAKQYLERVIKEHPDTPWAYFAERELEMPIGWKWAEY